MANPSTAFRCGINLAGNANQCGFLHLKFGDTLKKYLFTIVLILLNSNALAESYFAFPTYNSYPASSLWSMYSGMSSPALDSSIGSTPQEACASLFDSVYVNYGWNTDTSLVYSVGKPMPVGSNLGTSYGYCIYSRVETNGASGPGLGVDCCGLGVYLQTVPKPVVYPPYQYTCGAFEGATCPFTQNTMSAFADACESIPISDATSSTFYNFFQFLPYNNPPETSRPGCAYLNITGPLWVLRVVCPPPSTPDPTNTQCVPDQETYTLTLTPESATIEPGQSYTFSATVTKQGGGAPSIPVPVLVKVDVDPTSGGHSHGDGGRPKGSLSTTSGVTSFPITFSSTEISGIHTITATCDLCVNSPKAATVQVMIKAAQTGDLITIPASPTLYALTDSNGDVIGAVKNVHTDNHYLTKAAIGKLGNLAILYKTKVNSKMVLYLNDASLVWGGLFDVDVDNPWSTPHSSHDIGTSLDIRAQNSFPIKEGAVPITDFLKFITESKKNHFRVALHCKGSTQTSVCYGRLDNRHFHVDF